MSKFRVLDSHSCSSEVVALCWPMAWGTDEFISLTVVYPSGASWTSLAGGDEVQGQDCSDLGECPLLHHLRHRPSLPSLLSWSNPTISPFLALSHSAHTCNDCRRIVHSTPAQLNLRPGVKPGHAWEGSHSHRSSWGRASWMRATGLVFLGNSLGWEGNCLQVH